VAFLSPSELVHVPACDAAFAFKTGFSARALIGLLGSDDFALKVTPDGRPISTRS
jgi:hypothetical protein